MESRFESGRGHQIQDSSGGDVGDVSRVGMQASSVERCCLIKIQSGFAVCMAISRHRAKSLNVSN